MYKNHTGTPIAKKKERERETKTSPPAASSFCPVTTDLLHLLYTIMHGTSQQVKYLEFFVNHCIHKQRDPASMMKTNSCVVAHLLCSLSAFLEKLLLFFNFAYTIYPYQKWWREPMIQDTGTTSSTLHVYPLAHSTSFWLFFFFFKHI